MQQAKIAMRKAAAIDRRSARRMAVLRAPLDEANEQAKVKPPTAGFWPQTWPDAAGTQRGAVAARGAEGDTAVADGATADAAERPPRDIWCAEDDATCPLQAVSPAAATS